MYARILVPLDGSALAERALNHAETIARGTGAEIILLQVVQAPLGNVPEVGAAGEVDAFREAASGARAYLRTIAERLGSEGLKTRIAVAEGEPPTAILGMAHNEDVDVIVMSTHGRSGVSRILMGSVAETVMLTTKRPVMLVKPEPIHVDRVEEADVFLSAH